MHTHFTRYVSAELFQLRKRSSTWVLLGIWAVLAGFFGYILPYLSQDELNEMAQSATLQLMLPQGLVENMMAGFPFYGGALALMVGVLSVGSEYNWGTYKTLFTQRPQRGVVLGARLVAIAITLVLFAVVPFVVGAGSSLVIAGLERAAISWPDGVDLALGLLASWVILLAWAAVGVLLATVTRGTSMAIGIGIIYALVLEGLISNFANNISWLEPVIQIFLRANAYSLITPLGVAGETGDGPGGYAGPILGVQQSLVTLTLWIVISLGVSWWLVRTRDVT